ncbi:MAG: rhodanese-like domain-containing protein [Proteobacteria bacterium]|nr:rhodanese-like domain-containing protein [Pseudomonadota bacterium]
MKTKLTAILSSVFIGLFALTFTGTAEATEPKGIESKEAYEMVMASPADTFIVDVRTVAEYIFVGHPDLPNGVANIPLKFFPSWETNREFVPQVAARYKKSDTLIIICRSGGRAKAAATVLNIAGFDRTLYMTDSFEGALDEAGHRTVSGWKVNDLPYTYELKEELLYR